MKSMWIRAGIMLAALACVAAGAQQTVVFNIEPQPLRAALKEFGEQAGLQVLLRMEGAKTEGVVAPQVSGQLSAREALDRLLANTGLAYEFVNERTVRVGAAADKKVSAPAAADWKLAQTAQSDSMQKVESADAPSAQNQTAPSREPEESKVGEIVVTATKRGEERIQDVPMSIAVVTNEDIERRGLIGMEDYLRAIPGVNQIDLGASDNAIVVRGITTSPQGENFASGATVATYFGETPITGAGGLLVGGADVRPVDLERIEMLRGPQGTTFGSAALSGALRLIPKAPELDRYRAKVSAAYSQTSRRGNGNNVIQAVANFPVVEDRFGVRVVGYRYDESGSYRNIVGLDPASLAVANQWGVGNLVSGFVDDDLGRRLSTGGRIAALWQATDSLRFALNVLTQKIEQEGRPFANLGLYEQVQFPVAPIRRVDGDPGEYAESNLDLYNIVMDYDLSWATLTTTASWADSGVSPLLVAGGSPFPFTNATYMDVESFTAETRIASRLAGRFQFVAGLFYEDTDNPNVQFSDWLGAGVAQNPLPSLGLPATDPLSVIHTTRKVAQHALFGELSYALTDQVTATVGGRYFDYEKQELRLAEGGLFRIPYGAGTQTDIRNDEIDHTLKANVAYKPARDALIYASWSQGFRLGRPTPGVNPGLCDLNNDGLIDGRNVTIESTRTIDSDFLDSAEIGAKFALFDRRMTIDVAAYHSKWDGLPISVSLPQTGTCRGSYTANVGAAKSVGTEMQASFLVIEGLKLTAGGGYTEAELTRDAPALLATKGARLPGAPRVSANLGAQYDFQIAAHKAFVRADSFYAGEFYGDLLETPGLKAGEYIKVDARAGIAFGPLSAELFVMNLTNQDDFTWRGISGGTNPFFGYRLRPRTVGLQLSYDFE